jgi:SH3-like domain-containing protein
MITRGFFAFMPTSGDPNLSAFTRRGLRLSSAARILVCSLGISYASLISDSASSSPSSLLQLAQAEDPLRARPKSATRRRFVSLRSDEVNVRVGPGVRYPIKWRFRQKLIPVEIVQEYDAWRKIRDWEGAEGWVHRAMLSNRRSIIVTGRMVTLRRRSSDEAPAVARLGRGMVAELGKCTPAWCRVEVDNYEGWIRREGFWGLRKIEILP